MPECIEKKKLLKAIEESEPDVMADYGEYYGSEWGISRGKLYEIIANLPTLTPPNEWVSVEERLPEVGQEVLVYWRNTSQKAEHFELTHYDGDHWFLLDNTERPWIVVVAWMPLPSPPDRRPPEGDV